MNKTELKQIISGGEDSRLQLKADLRNADRLAAEMVAFSNSEGGRILIGVSDKGKVIGIPSSEVGRINQLISNAASQHVRSPHIAGDEKCSCCEGAGCGRNHHFQGHRQALL